MLDPERWNVAKVYLEGPLPERLIEVQAEVNTLRAALSIARITRARLEDECRLEHWEESVAAQDRAIAIECRAQYNIAEQTECDLQQLLDEREVLMLLIGHS